jgi:hypothetical protein
MSGVESSAGATDLDLIESKKAKRSSTVIIGRGLARATSRASRASKSEAPTFLCRSPAV